LVRRNNLVIGPFEASHFFPSTVQDPLWQVDEPFLSCGLGWFFKIEFLTPPEVDQGGWAAEWEIYWKLMGIHVRIERQPGKRDGWISVLMINPSHIQPDRADRQTDWNLAVVPRIYEGPSVDVRMRGGYRCSSCTSTILYVEYSATVLSVRWNHLVTLHASAFVLSSLTIHQYGSPSPFQQQPRVFFPH
jgi:hypothetical protein